MSSQGNRIYTMRHDAVNMVNSNDRQVALPPEECVIDVTIEASVRQVGKYNLAHEIAEFLKSKGYVNVISDEYQRPEGGEKIVEAQKKVTIVVNVK